METTLSIILGSLGILGFILTFGDKIFNRGSKERNITDRVSTLEKGDCDIRNSIGNIDSEIKNIKENHLTHIQNDITDIKVSMGQVETTLQFLKDK